MQAEHSQRGSGARVAALRGGLALLALSTVLAAAGPATTAASQAQPQAGGGGAPSRATVIEAQRLFQQLGYPLGPKALGGFGPQTKGALRYFQHKYGLPVTGLPDPHTLLLMRTVATSLKGRSASGAAHASPPHDAVEGVLGGDVPILAIAVCLAALLGVLALTARHRAA